jgi:hypothetical protein
MDDHLLACQQIIEKVPHSDTLAKERASFLKVNDINDISFLGTPHHHHHQPINVPTAGAQAFLMDYPQGERAITHHAGPVWIGGC